MQRIDNRKVWKNLRKMNLLAAKMYIIEYMILIVSHLRILRKKAALNMGGNPDYEDAHYADRRSAHGNHWPCV